MSEFIINMDTWDRSDGAYIYPNTPKECSWYDVGLIPKNDFTADVFGWYGFTFETEIHGKVTVEVTAGLLDFGEVNVEETIDYYKWSAVIYGDGVVTVTAPINQFNLFSSMPAKWRFLRSLKINRPVKNLRAVKGRAICAEAQIKSKSADAGETIEYTLSVANCTDKTQAVSFEFEKSGYEVLSPDVSGEEIILAPFEEQKCSVKVTMSDKIVPAGYEKHRLHITPNGNGAYAETVELYSVRHLPHPYILHTPDGWEQMREKCAKYDWARKIADDYISRAETWTVPEVGCHNNGMFPTKESEQCYNAAVCYMLTGNIEYAKKSALFLTRLAEDYPARRKAGSQQLVHEGEFFKYTARAYDMVCNAGVLSAAEHESIRRTFRLFIDFLDWALCDGGVSNWSLAEGTGALYSAMALQDREKIERFTFGTGGILEHLKAGVMSDGWWCECSIGYNQMVAGLFSECAFALQPWGINIAHQWVEPNYSGKVSLRGTHTDGLSWDIYGGNDRNYRSIEDVWDSLVYMANYKSVVQGVNDSSEEFMSGATPVSYDSRYDIAYALYKKPEYAKIIINGGDKAFRDIFRGEGELPNIDNDFCHRSCYFDNGGIAMLRTNTTGRADEEQIEASLKYGSHGGAHGHYDRCALNAVSRNGRSLFNPENIWYSYGTFMYKFFVQTSITHNMVTVDLKMQDPSEAKRILFHSGTLFHAAAIEDNAKWSNPPYGGWRVKPDEDTFEDRTWCEGRYVPIPDDAPPYSTRTGFTEAIEQRRCMVLTDDYVVCFDYMSGDTEHDYDCIYHLKGLRETENAEHTGHRDKLTDDPLSSAQFITEVDTYSINSDTRLAFSYEYTDELSGKAPWITGRHPFRSGHNTVGTENADLYYVTDSTAELIVGCDPEYYPVSKRLFYSVMADGEIIADGKFGAWIFGRHHIDADVSGKHELKLTVRTEDGMVDHSNVPETVKTIFWGDPYFITADGEKIYLADIAYITQNVDMGSGIGVDYDGGPVKIEGTQYDKAVPSDVIDKSGEGVITVDISGINAVRFVSEIGGDYPVGDESDRRRFVSLRKHGKSAGFISVLEPYAGKRMIERVEYIGESAVAVTLADGRRQIITAEDMQTGKNISVRVDEYIGDKLVRSETTE